jgi:hypothetical protein
MAVGKPLMDQKPTHQVVRQGRSADDMIRFCPSSGWREMCPLRKSELAAVRAAFDTTRISTL